MGDALSTWTLNVYKINICVYNIFIALRKSWHFYKNYGLNIRNKLSNLSGHYIKYNLYYRI